MFGFFKKLRSRYKLISFTAAEIFRLEELIDTCNSKDIRTETYKKLIGVRTFWSELTGKSWKSQKPHLRAENFNIIKTAKK